MYRAPPIVTGGQTPGTAQLAADCDVVIALLPQGRTSPSPFGTGAVEEVDNFAGSAFGVFADDASLDAFGPNPLDPACRAPSASAGRVQGKRIAGEIADFLGR